MKSSNKAKSAVEIVAVGAALAAAAAGAYFFLGPKGKQNRKHAKAWAVKMKADVVEKLEEARDVSEPVYHQIVDTVADQYAKGKKASQKEVAELAKDLKKHWKNMSKAARAVKKEAIKGAKRLTA